MNNHIYAERHTNYVAIHPYYGYVLKPNSIVDFGLKVPDHFGHGVHIQTDHNGFRNVKIPERKPEGELWIGLFGGSVAMSILSSDNSKTISGFLESALNLSFAGNGKHIRVINFALPGGQQPQQLLIFLNNVDSLDGIVTFDGYNEITVPLIRNMNNTPEWFPYFPYYYELFAEKADDERQALIWILRFIEAKRDDIPFPFRSIATSAINRLSSKIKKRLNIVSDYNLENFKSLYLTQSNLHKREPLDIMKDGAKRWHDHILLMNEIASTRGINSLFVLQPIPEIGKELTTSEHSFFTGKEEFSDTRTKGYRRLLHYGQILETAGVSYHDFSNIFHNMKEDIYGDITHFEDKGCEIVAQQMANKIRDKWGIFA